MPVKQFGGGANPKKICTVLGTEKKPPPQAATKISTCLCVINEKMPKKVKNLPFCVQMAIFF